MALKPSSLNRAPNPIPYSASLLSKLPVELTLLIFLLCHPGLRARLDLTNVCRQWRSIAINSPSLWTFIHISIDFPSRSKRADHMIALLDLQLSRVGGFPLDVEWISNTTTAFDPRLLELIRQKGPFSQWRTLKVRSLDTELEPDDAFTLDSRDVFSNLESLIILPSFCVNKILKTIDRTTTSKLQFLELQSSRTTQAEVEANYRGMMQRIRCLKIPSMDITSIPSNILEVETTLRTTHHFPHIQKYTLMFCVFKSDQLYDLGSLTHLRVTLEITLQDDVTVYLPALRHLACGILITGRRTKIDAPLLESLHLLSVKPRHGTVQDMIDSLNLDGYVLSPTKSITIDAYLPQHTIVAFLEQSPRVARVSLSYKDAASAGRMLERMEGATHAEESEGITLGGRLCEKMVELRIKLGVDAYDLEFWKRRAARLVRIRRTFGSDLRVYASWNGEEPYVCLA
jgi:hypothetical protein